MGEGEEEGDRGRKGIGGGGRGWERGRRKGIGGGGGGRG